MYPVEYIGIWWGVRGMHLNLTSWLSTWLKINQRGHLIWMKVEKGIWDIGGRVRAQEKRKQH